MMEGVQWWRCAYALASLPSVQGIKEGPNSALILLQDPCGESHDHVMSACYICTCVCSVNLHVTLITPCMYMYMSVMLVASLVSVCEEVSYEEECCDRDTEVLQRMDSESAPTI